MTRAEYEAKKQSLLAEIESAFGGVERDEGVTESIKNLDYYQTRDKEKLLNTEARWQDVPDQWIQGDGESLLTFLDAHSFRYYLPAYLNWFLRFMDYDAYGAAFHMITCDLMLSGRYNDFQRAKFSELNLEQAQSVAHILVFQCERCIFLYDQEELETPESIPEFQGYKGYYGYKNLYEQFQRALSKHWSQFLSSNFYQSDFPYSAPSRTWRELWKVPDPRKREAYEAKKIALIAEIERVFDGVERGDGVTLHEAEVIDDYGGPEARAEARLLDSEKRWQDVPYEDMSWGSGSLYFMDDKGFHYYFPAYLVCSLHFSDCEDEAFNWEAFDSLDCILGVLYGAMSGWSFAEKFDVFTGEQKRTIAHFVQFRHEQVDFWLERQSFPFDPEDEESTHAEIQWALDNYWGQFLK